MKNLHLSAIPTTPKENIGKDETKMESELLIKSLREIQEKLYAQHKYSLLIILQGLDTSGKDNAVKNVFFGLNPSGTNVYSYKVPTPIEQDHHFLWRINKNCPSKGMISIFNRSHYEDIFVPKINNSLSSKALKNRVDSINQFEKDLKDNNTIIVKFYIHISHDEQCKRLEERKVDPNKKWKYAKDDHIEKKEYTEYLNAFEFVIDHCNYIPWHVVAGDKKWYKNYSILKEIVKQLKEYEIEFPADNQH
jgi:PPK2 family polyphosphate:nucleotide phosphotransferase